MCTPMFTAALFIVARMWKQPKCPLPGGQIKQLQYIHTMKYYSIIKKKERMLFAVTCMDIEIVTLSEVSQKDKYHMISLICGL